MRIPYTYALKCPDDRVYYGAKYGKDANPDTFWNNYFTSSDEVQELREQYGDDMFEYEIRRIFDSPDDCLAWEHKVLRRLNASGREDMINKTNGGGTNIATERVQNGTHHTLDMEWQKKNNPFFNPEWQKEHGKVVADYWANRTEPHHAKLEKNRKAVSDAQTALVSKGKHSLQQRKTCPDCGLTSSPRGISQHKCRGING